MDAVIFRSVLVKGLVAETIARKASQQKITRNKLIVSAIENLLAENPAPKIEESHNLFGDHVIGIDVPKIIDEKMVRMANYSNHDRVGLIYEAIKKYIL